MQFTPIRVLTCVLAMPFVIVVGTAACGQVTGLSNDYVFDLQQDGGTAAADAPGDSTPPTDGAKLDAPTDAPKDATGIDAAKCSQAAASSAETVLTGTTGTMACKDCLSNECCSDVSNCFNSNECKKALECRLDCTTRTTALDRHDCFVICDSNAGGNTTPMLYTTGVGACSTMSCDTTATCGFQ